MTGVLERSKAAAQVVAADLDVPEMSSDDEKHLAKVLRLRVGEKVVATDGQGSWRMCTWSDRGDLTPESPVHFEPRLDPPITIGFSILKGDKSEWVIQKLTEVGVDVIIPVISEHTVVRWDDKKMERNHERFIRVAYEAAMQSKRVWLPAVKPIAKLSVSEGVALAHPGGNKISLETPSVIVGPEGGWSEKELADAKTCVDLGPAILRAETASIAVGVLLTALRSK